MNMTSKCEESKTTKERSKTANTIEDVFPWLSEFNKIIRSSTGSRNYQYLEESLLLYTQHIRSSIPSNVKFGNCKFSVIYSNLKNHINNTLIFFHLYWFDIKQDIVDHTSYLNKMSTLLNIYIDMELKTSIHVRDPSKIAARIFAALYIYLNNSEEHIFKVLLRIKNMEKYTKICNHIFMKSFTNLKTKMTSITDVAYVRYLLAFKMWKKMEENSNKKKKINELAVMLLGPRMPELGDKLKFVPKPPKNEKNETPWFLHADLKHTLDHFLLFEDKMDNFKDLQRTKMKHQINSLFRWSNSSGPKQEINKDHKNDLKNHISSIDQNKSFKKNCENDTSNSVPHIQTSINCETDKNKKKSEQIKHKQNKILIIDITGDAEISKVKRKKTKLGYLRIMEENVKKNKKHINHLKSSNELIATKQENYNKSSINSVKNTCFVYKPISENKVSGSTTSYTSNSNRSSLNDVYCIENKHLNVTKNQISNTTADVINRNVGIYPKDALDKVALHMGVRPTTDSDNRENDTSNSVPHIIQTSINCETDTLSNNLSTDENNVPSIKENTNVILNGETVMLLPKSPNSNLYIINKAENVRDHNNDDESCPIKEKNWMISPEDCASFEVVNTSKHISFNWDLPQCKELSCQENKFPVGRNQSIKIDPEEEGSLMNITEVKSYGKKSSLSVDVLPATLQIYQDTNVANVSISNSIDILTYRQNIKQEFNNHIAPNCGIQGCSGIHSHPHEVIDPQHSLRIPVTHPTTISSIYGNCAGTDLYMPYHIVAHCRQCIHPATDSQGSYIENNSYFLRPAHSNTCRDKSNDTCTVSNAFNGDQIVKSALYSQHFDNVRMNDAKYSKTTMKEQERNNCDCEQQGRSDCDTSMSSDWLHSSELSAFDIDSIEMDSNEDSEIMKTDIDDSENIGFLHNIQIETLEDILSNDTDFLLPLKQSPYELDTMCTDTFSNKKDILCNNQNDGIDSNVESVAFRLNNGNTFLRLPAKSDESIGFKKPWNFGIFPDKLNNYALTKCSSRCLRKKILKLS